MMIMMMMMENECKRGTVWGGISRNRKDTKGRRIEILYIYIYVYIYYTHTHTHKDSIVKSTKPCLKKGHREKGVRNIMGTL
jgi:hypothetical protein